MDDTPNDDLLRASELLARHGPRGMLDLMAQISAQFATSVAGEGREDVAAQWAASSTAMERLATTLGATAGDGATTSAPAEEPEEDDGEDDADGDDTNDTDEDLGDEPDDEEEAEHALDDDEPEPAPTEEATGAASPTAATTPEPATPSGGITAQAKEMNGAVEPSTKAVKERVKMKTVAGQFSVSPKVTTCRLRNVLDSGQRGELVGRANERGIEESEWRVEMMTPERMRAWFGPGRYLFEWYGEDGKGGRMALGRSRAFRIFPDAAAATPSPAQSLAAAPIAAAPPSSGHALEQAFQISRYVDEKVREERERETRREEREHEMKKLQMEHAAKERLVRLQLEAKKETAQRAAAPPPDEAGEGYVVDESTLFARIDETVARRVNTALKAKGGEEDIELPGWLKALGINKSVLELAKPKIAEMIPSLLATLQPPRATGAAPLPGGATSESPAPTAVATPYPNVTRFVRKDGAGGGTG
jgi:hypothetical protein